MRRVSRFQANNPASVYGESSPSIEVALKTELPTVLGLRGSCNCSVFRKIARFPNGERAG